MQAADPEGKYGPSTSNVTVPYWNFTKRPSGARFPKAYEDPDSPLYTIYRSSDAIQTPYPFTSPYLLAYQIYFQDWNTFGGYPVGGAGNYGSFEAQIHNPMHSEYVNGHMASPSTAGLDPIFYAFHAYIDFIFEKWIEEHGVSTITSSRIFMRGEQDNELPKPVGFSEGTGTKRSVEKNGEYTKNMGRGEIYFDTRKQGYAYLPGPDGEFIPKATIQDIIDQHAKAGFTFGDNKTSLFSELISYGSYSANANPAASFHSDINLPTSQRVEAAIVEIVRTSASHDYSFRADVYLHPQNVNANIANKQFRDRYLISSSAYWALADHHDHSMPGSGSSLRLNQTVTPMLNSLLRGGKGGETWQLTLAISSEDPDTNYQFKDPTMNIR